MCVCILMVAEMAESAFSVQFPNIVQLRADCGDGRVCVFSAERGKCLGILMVAELADYAFSARFTRVISFVMVAAMVEFAFSVRMRNVCVQYVGCGGGGICVFRAVAHCFLDL